MRPRTIARPAAAGALCFASPCAARPVCARAVRNDNARQPTATDRSKPRDRRRAHRKLDAARGRARRRRAARVAPAVGGLIVSLQLQARGIAGSTIDRDRTDASGRYRLRERFDAPVSRRARIRVARGPGVRRTSAPRPPERLPLRLGVVVRARPLRQPHRLRRHARTPAGWASPTSRCPAARWSRSSAAAARSACR